MTYRLNVELSLCCLDEHESVFIEVRDENVPRLCKADSSRLWRLLNSLVWRKLEVIFTEVDAFRSKELK